MLSIDVKWLKMIQVNIWQVMTFGMNCKVSPYYEFIVWYASR